MPTERDDLEMFIAVAEARGFRDAARGMGISASALSESVRRLETRLGARLLHRTTRSVTPTEAGSALIARLKPALGEVRSALEAVTGTDGQPTGTLRLNVPTMAARVVLPALLPGFMIAHPRLRVEIATDDAFVDVLASGCDAGIRYGERLEQDMIAVPIGLRVQRFVTAAAPAYLDRHGRPLHPHDLLDHTCINGRFIHGTLHTWTFERDGELVHLEPTNRLVVQIGAASELAVEAAIAGVGVIHLFEPWLRPHVSDGKLEVVLADWQHTLEGPFLYYSSRHFVPPPLRAFIEYVQARR